MIKLKAYITCENSISYGKIVDVEWIDLKKETIGFNGVAFQNGFGLIEEAKKGEHVLIRFSGRQDVTGKDIYEGDICKSESYPCRDEDEYLIVIEYKDGAFYVVERLKKNSTARGISDGIADYIYEEDDLTIIGNIYENNNLLKKEYSI